VATVAAIELTGAMPVLVDIDPHSYTMDANCLREALRDHPSGRPRAVVPVHLYGYPADMPAICQIGKEHGLYVVEDCAQAHGAGIDGRSVATWGHMASFSFYPTKNLGALGDGGAVVSGDAELAEKVRSLREYGWCERYVSETPGRNSRLDPLQAAILRAKLPHLDAENARRISHAVRYGELLAEVKIGLPVVRLGVQHVYHQFVIRTARRDALREYLRDCGVSSAIHYPVPVHRQPAYAGRVTIAGELRHSDAAAGEILSLPMYPELTLTSVDTVAQRILEWDSPNQ
jgi:dTDP-4-amino-4,6-dideoxygalactose transaminase